MPEFYIQALNTDDAGAEEPSATRERLRGAFPPGATRRMTQLGMLTGAVLAPLAPREEEAVIYASRFGESRSLETYLDGFPSASPTLFQTSIHPSGVQQALIGRQAPCTQLFPLSGGEALVTQALLTAWLAGAERCLFCGGEERGTWLVEHGAASTESFAFAMALGRDPSGGPYIGRLRLEQVDGEGALPLRDWFSLLHQRRPFDGLVACGWRLCLEWR